ASIDSSHSKNSRHRNGLGAVRQFIASTNFT
ncbi:unnamed protein product, partial [Litomosoides sigmodontis]